MNPWGALALLFAFLWVAAERRAVLLEREIGNDDLMTCCGHRYVSLAVWRRHRENVHHPWTFAAPTEMLMAAAELAGKGVRSEAARRVGCTCYGRLGDGLVQERVASCPVHRVKPATQFVMAACTVCAEKMMIVTSGGVDEVRRSAVCLKCRGVR